MDGWFLHSGDATSGAALGEQNDPSALDALETYWSWTDVINNKTTLTMVYLEPLNHLSVAPTTASLVTHGAWSRVDQKLKAKKLKNCLSDSLGKYIFRKLQTFIPV